MNIRELDIADIPALREIDRCSFAIDDQYDESFYRDVVLGDEFQAVGVVADCGTLAAWALVARGSRPVRVRTLAVSPAWRRRGFATALMNAICAEHGEIDLLVKPGNARAIALYRKLGFIGAQADPQMPERLRMVRASRSAG